MAVEETVPEQEYVSHGDIYHKLGTLEGKIESVLLQLAEKRTNINSLFTRVRDIEHKMAWGMGALAILSIVAPTFITLVSPKLHIVPETQLRSETRAR